jgi:hypothetical protein
MNPNRFAASAIVLALVACSSGCSSNDIEPGWSDDGGPEGETDSTIPTDSSSGDGIATTESGADTGGGAAQDSTTDSLEGDALDAPAETSVFTDASADVHADSESPTDASDSSTTADVAAPDAVADVAGDVVQDAPADVAAESAADAATD